MTQAELAQKLGVPFQSISQWERDVRKPKKETIASIAKALNVDPLELSDDIFDAAFLELLNNTFSSSEDYRKAFLNNEVIIAALQNKNDYNLIYYYNMLNADGEDAAVAYIMDLAMQEKYLKDIYAKKLFELRKSQSNEPDDNK